LSLEDKLAGSFNSEKPLMYLITPGNLTSQNFASKSKNTLEIIEFASKTNVSLVQIREKFLNSDDVCKLATEAVKLSRKTGTKILINDRADIAVAAKADGVHLTVNSISPTIIRRNLKHNFIIGASTHSLEAAKKRKNDGADFVTFGPVFQTPSKAKYGAPQGLEKLRAVCESLDGFPVIALGGIDENNYRSTLQSSAKGFAAIRFLNDLENLEKFR